MSFFRRWFSQEPPRSAPNSRASSPESAPASDAVEEREVPAGDSKLDDIPITNPRLLAAINAWVANAIPARQDAYVQELRCATFLVPVVNPEPDAPAGPEGTRPLHILAGAGAAGDAFIPLFTDLDAIRRWTDRECGSMVLPAVSAWQIVMANPDYAAAVINPGDLGLRLDRDLIGFLHQENQPRAE